MKKTYIRVRTQFEGYHHYPNAGSVDSRIQFLENQHRHMFKVEIDIETYHQDRELEFFLVKWSLENFLSETNQNNKSCEMIADEILTSHLIPNYGKRYYKVCISEDGESDGIIEYQPE